MPECRGRNTKTVKIHKDTCPLSPNYKAKEALEQNKAKKSCPLDQAKPQESRSSSLERDNCKSKSKSRSRSRSKSRSPSRSRSRSSSRSPSRSRSPSISRSPSPPRQKGSKSKDWCAECGGPCTGACRARGAGGASYTLVPVYPTYYNPNDGLITLLVFFFLVFISLSVLVIVSFQSSK